MRVDLKTTLCSFSWKTILVEFVICISDKLFNYLEIFRALFIRFPPFKCSYSVIWKIQHSTHIDRSKKSLFLFRFSFHLIFLHLCCPLYITFLENVRLEQYFNSNAAHVKVFFWFRLFNRNLRTHRKKNPTKTT